MNSGYCFSLAHLAAGIGVFRNASTIGISQSARVIMIVWKAVADVTAMRETIGSRADLLLGRTVPPHGAYLSYFGIAGSI